VAADAQRYTRSFARLLKPRQVERGALMIQFAIVSVLALLSIPASALAQSCAGNPVAIQILGSGGPRVNRDRASSSYLLWIGAQARILVDIGGGAFLRFGQAQAKLSDLSLVAISHLHPDHVSDLPALLWLSHQARKDPLPIAGPSGNDVAPSFPTFLSRLFDEKNGAFQVLGPTLGATQGKTGGGVRLDVGVIDVTKAEPSTAYDQQGVTVTALGIPHGNLPTLAYRVQTRDVSVVFSSDQTGTNPRFVEFAKGANVLVMHLAIAAGETSPLHAAPAVVGRVARDAGVGRLIVSHIGLFDLDAAIAELKKVYTGPLTVGADLQCASVQ
jgi:ribonuclease BN (tRNA processing enzyme)